MLLSVRRLVFSVLAGVVGVLVFASASALAAAPEVPEVSVAGPVPATSVVVTGVLDPGVEGGPGTYELGTYEFLYRQGKAGCVGEGKAPESPGISLGGGKEGVAQELSGLLPNTEYSVCLLARNGTKGETTVSAVVTFKTALPPETPETLKAEPVGSTGATLHGVLNPANPEDPGSYEFVYRASASECQGEGALGGSALGEAKEAVAVEVGGLQPSTRYTFCLLARNEAGETAIGPPVSFTTLSQKPAVSGEAVSHLGLTGATVSAQIDTGGVPASYSVQYGTTSAYGSETTVKNISAGLQTVTIGLTGLQSDTEYHFRFLVSNEDGAESGSDVVFTTYPVAVPGLPDGRVYEQVSNFGIPSSEAVWPGESPEGSEYDNSYLPFEASVDGERVVFAGTSDVGGSGKEGNTGNQFLASRHPDGGWGQTNIGPLGDQSAKYEAFSSDLSAGALSVRFFAVPPFVTTETPTELLYPPSKVETYTALYTRTFDKGGYRPLFTGTPSIRSGQQTGELETGQNEFSARIVVVSPDSSRVLFEANDTLIEGHEKLEQEFDSIVEKEAKQAKEVGALGHEYKILEKEGDILELEGRYAEAQVKLEEANIKSEKYVALRSLYDDDHRYELYVSVDSEPSLVNISPEGRALPGASFGGDHEISSDGSRIFWTSKENPSAVFVREGGVRTVQVSEGPARFWTASMDGRYAFYTEAGKLWRFDVDDGTRVELAGSAGGVQGVIGTNETGEDGSYVYFVAQEALTSQPNAAGETAVGGQENLYVAEPDPGSPGGSRIVFIAALSGVPSAYMTPDGHGLVFSSSLNLTGRPYPDEGSEEVYVFDAHDSSLFCASCRAQVSGGNLVSGHRWISEDGNEVFFDSEAPLTANDINGVRDVYEWERYGTNGCGETDGCVYLLSGGVEGVAELLDASANGENVFILTRQRLLSEGQNQNLEVYDARVDGLFTVAPPQCSGTACQGSPASAPVFATPSSVTFNGVGNFPLPTVSGIISKTKRKTLTRSQKLSRALKDCHAKHGKARRACESNARKVYSAKNNTRKSVKRRAA